jgi:hypothetical protein
MVEEHTADPIAARSTEAKQKETTRSPTPMEIQPPEICSQPLPQGHPFGRRSEYEPTDARH